MSEVVTAWAVLALAAFAFGAGYLFCRLQYALGWIGKNEVTVSVNLDRAALIDLLQQRQMIDSQQQSRRLN